MVVGGGALTPLQVREFEQTHSADFQVLRGPALMNTIVVMNAAKVPTNDIHLRKLIMHAVNKAAIVDSELAGSSVVADSLFPKDTPYCNIDLTPRWDYDLEKAKLLNCNPPQIVEKEVEKIVEKEVPAATDNDSGDDLPLILGVTIGVCVLMLLAIGAACYVGGQRRGREGLLQEQKEERKRQMSEPGATEVGVPDNVA